MVRPRRFTWLDALIAACAAGGLTASTLYHAQLRTSTYAASDFKTLYASVWCFVHRMDAYSVANLKQVFVANNVEQPATWWGHAPVYPWPTLAVLSPFAGIGLVPAAYLLTILSGVLMAVAITGLMRYAADYFDLGPFWRILIAPLCTIGPLFAFGMGMANVSVATCAFCFMAFVLRNSGTPWSRGVSLWLPGTALALAFLLKPHLAVWVGIAMLLLPERASRAVVIRCAAVVGGFTAATAAFLAATGTLGLQTHSYLAMLAEETSTGASMNATSREVLPVASQITSLQSILGFWIGNPTVRVSLSCAALLGLGFLVLRQTRRVDSERGAMLAVSAWCTLGMLATYHRAHDAVLLLLVVPWVVDRIRRAPQAWPAWAVVVLYGAMSLSAQFPDVERWVAGLPTYSLAGFLLLRQVGLADLLLLLVLLIAMTKERAHVRSQAMAVAEAHDDLHAAA
ncbi:MAG TPA: glycosyltransferase 87 family protein [Acidobacteriaceae bacterium]|jgi:hypothetical protein